VGPPEDAAAGGIPCESFVYVGIFSSGLEDGEEAKPDPLEGEGGWFPDDASNIGFTFDAVHRVAHAFEA